MYERFSSTSKFSGSVLGASIDKHIVVASSTTSGVISYAQNPLGVKAIAEVTRVFIHEGSDAACALDIGTALTIVSSDNLIDGLSVNAAANTVYDSIEDGGTHGRTRQYLAPGAFMTVAVASGDANGLVADVQFNFIPLTGGQGGMAER